MDTHIRLPNGDDGHYLLMEIQDRCEVQISDDQYSEIETVKDIFNLCLLLKYEISYDDYKLAFEAFIDDLT